MASSGDSISGQIARFERRRPSPGDASPRITKERVSPGMPHRRSIQPESSPFPSPSSSSFSQSPSRTLSPSTKRMGTPEGSASASASASASSPFNQTQTRPFGSKKPILPGDMSDQSLPTPRRKPPSPGMKKMPSKIKARPPSPGMGMKSMSSRGPPSPGMGMQMGQTSPHKTLARSRAPPSPGRLSPAPPMLDSHAPESDRKNSPMRQKSVKFEESPSSASVSSVSKGPEKEIENDKENSSKEDGNSQAQERFVFTKKPTGVKPPSQIDVSSAEGSAVETGGDKTETKPIAVVKSPPMAKPSSPVRSLSAKKSQNPLRSNPLFLQKFAEASDSDSDSDSDDSELRKLNDYKPQSPKKGKKLSAMAKMKKLAALSSISPEKSKKGTEEKNSVSAGLYQMEMDDNSTLPTVDGMSQKENAVLIISDEPTSTSNHPSQWNTRKQSPRRISQLAERLNKKKVVSKKSLTSPMDDNESGSVPSSSANSKSAESNSAMANDVNKDGEEESDNSPSAQHDESNHSTDDDEDFPLPPILIKTQISSPQKIIAPSPSRRKLASVKKMAHASRKNSFSAKTTSSSPGNKENVEGPSTEKEIAPKNKLRKESPIRSFRERRSKIEKLRTTVGEEKKEAMGALREPSEASFKSTSSNRSTSTTKSRREMLERARSRVSRSPSPSPLLKKHLSSKESNSSPKQTPTTERKKSLMKKMVEAREMKSQISPRESSPSSRSGKEKLQTNRYATKPESKVQPTPPSLMTAPSDEQAPVTDILALEITKSDSSEHLSVRKGLTLLKQQSALKSFRPSDDKVPVVKKEKKESISQNLLRVRILKEKQKEREELKNESMADLHSKPTLKSPPKHSQENTDKSEDDLSLDSTSKEDLEEDDEFSIDEFPINSPNLNHEPSPSSTLMASPPATNRSQWAENMQQKLREGSNSPENFNFDGHEHSGWDSDSSANKSRGRKQRESLPKTKPPIAKNIRAAENKSSEAHTNGGNRKMHARNLMDDNQQSHGYKNSVSFRQQQSPRSPQSESQNEQAENYFVGAYEELLTRRTNPFLVRIVNPTLPSSLITSQLNTSTFNDVNDVESLSADGENNGDLHSLEEALITENNPLSTEDEPTPVEDTPPQAPDSTFASALNSFVPDPSNDTTEDVLPPKEFEESNRIEGDRHRHTSLSPKNTGFPPTENPSNALLTNPTKTDDGSQQDSTLLGQVHVSSMDESTLIENGNSESVADWWENSYAHTQNDDVNKNVQKSLSKGTLLETDSDDDVFFGIEDKHSGDPHRTDSQNHGSVSRKQHAAAKGSRNHAPRRVQQTTVARNQKHTNKRGQQHRGGRGLIAADPSDDSDFDEIMDGDDEPMPPPPPPPPTSTPPNRPSSAKHKAPVTNNVFIPDMGEGKSNDSKQQSRARMMTISNEQSTFDSTLGSRTYKDGTFDEDTYDDRSYSSKGSTSDGSHTFGSATLESMALNERERKKWSAWDKKDHSVYSNDSTYDSGYTIDTKQRNRILERRARAHEQLLMHAYTALSKPPQRPSSGKVGASENLSQFLGGSYDVENQAPGALQNTDTVKPSKSIMKQRQILEKFCVKIKNIPFEVLKLNRENKWQTKYLTVSKEGSWLNNGTGSKVDSCFCPLALLWVKKLNSSNDHSVTTIDKQGRGGMIFTHLSKVKVGKGRAKGYPLSKKQSDKFRDSVIVTLFSDGGKGSGVTFRCTKGAAENISVGCSAIIDVLRGQKSSKKHIANGSSSQQYVANHQAATQMHYPNNETFGKNVMNDRSMSHEDDGGVVVVARSYADEGAPHLWEA